MIIRDRKTVEPVSFYEKVLLIVLEFLDSFVKECGRGCIFFSSGFVAIFGKPYRFREMFRHMEFIGNRSFSIIVLTATFTGMALCYQSALAFKEVGATNLVGATVFLAIARELGPALTGLVVAARAGGTMAARLGTMRVYEQIDAMQVMGVNPVKFLVSPRIVAALVMMPFLCGVFDVFAMLGAHLLAVNVLDLDSAVFWEKIQIWGKTRDIVQGLVKSAVFGLIFSGVCTYKGYHARGGAKGVGEATNTGVVNSMVLIIVINFFVTNIFMIITKVWESI